MTPNSTFILFGQTNTWIANRDSTFNRRTRIAHNYEYCTAMQASDKLMTYCGEDSDNYIMNDDGTAMMYDDQIVMQRGDMSYEHDSRTWEFIALADLSEKDAAIALRDLRLDDQDTEAIYDLWPALRPEETTDED